MRFLNKKVLRILDANANRCREGLRVVEDIARFIKLQPREAARAKRLRHLVTAGILALGPEGKALLETRDAQKDSGRRDRALSERKRRDLGDVLSCNLHRAQEAARVLEEFGKLFNPRGARIFKETRFGIYTLEKRMLAGWPLKDR
jgi:thiamine-phosphate pyrophosphorylase